MKQNIFQKSQTWRIITLCLCIAMVIVMLIPGVCPTLTQSINGGEYFDAGNYLRPNSWSIFFCWGALAASCLCLILRFLGFLTKTNAPVQTFLLELAVLVFIGFVFLLDDPLQFWKDGYYLPIVPPILAVGIISSSFLGSYWDKQNQAERRKLIKRIGASFLTVVCILTAIFIVTRYSRYTTYIPFSGRIFDVTPEEVRKIRVANSDACIEVNFDTEEGLEEICDVLNSLRYRSWFPSIPIGMGGWSCGIFIYSENQHYFYQFGEEYLLCRGIWYKITPETLSPLLEYVKP